jgi:Na+-translocating ferredoxin:NAD+ oxidoreductase RnfA subunit
VAELVVGVNEGSSKQYKCSDNNIDLKCVNCVVLNEKLQNVLKEYQLVQSIIAFLPDDLNNIHESHSTRQQNSSVC